MVKTQEAWSSRLGVILAVAGSAVGLGNFLRFPGLAAQYGGASFMIAYFISLVLLGIPIGWAEWTMGRKGGIAGYHSSPGIFHAIVKHPCGKYLGLLGFIIPVMVYMYYVYIEAWCLGYALNAATGVLSQPGMNYSSFFATFTGAGQDGASIHFGLHDVGIFVVIVYALNFFFIYRGISKGVEFVCKWGMPVLIVIALIILARVLTLGTPDPAKPDQNVLNGLGFMWNPKEIVSGLKNPQLWLAAAGQIFFSLSVGFGAIITYASYLKKKDDVVLSGLTAASANEFCEVALGGLITVPAAFVFLGAAGIVGMGTFGLGFNVLPHVFAQMAFGQFFATIFYLLLFLAAITSSLSMLQPGIAFFEEGLGLGRKSAMGVLGLLTALGTALVWWFSKDLKALDTIDFWIGTVGIFICGTILIIVFGWVIGIDEGVAEAHQGAEMRIPAFYKPVMKYITPLYLLAIFVMFILANVFGWNFTFGAGAEFKPTGYITDLVGENPSAPARIAFGFIIITIIFVTLLVAQAGKRWEAADKNKLGGTKS
ncbi:Sodium:neurotransmitter symporter family protein [Lacunisphaera limnophila]|uniref:Sodium:neurotransmitter symporter family protein n=1 Tax=Lacunisphaera limnophila TaxID=1838286 RepID=A0A1D8ARL2_9BACT|nr:sodium-dependent transporter [Lacunisphaera limnophila]AOS43533.1 Sodium:neurotransmitter symporter family protein [Lacunisphaera limnophila]